MKILKSILNYIPLATFIIFVVTDGIFSLTSALIFVISTIGLLINCKRKNRDEELRKFRFVELRKSEFIKENIDETIFMFALFKCGKSDKGRNWK